LSQHLILGVDPGLSGALALYDPAAKTLRALIDMPLTYEKRRHIDTAALANFIEIHAADILFAVIERVHAMPEQGVSSTFRFGDAFGLVCGMCASSNLPVHFVEPAVWKILMGLSHDKNRSRDKAMGLFPAHAADFKRKKDDGRAEAALLAYFGERLLIRKES